MLSPRRNWLNGLLPQMPNRRARLSRTISRREPSEVLEARALLSAVMNEVYVNPTASPDANREFIEIRTTSNNESLSNLWFLQIEGDGTAAGTVDTALDLGSLSTGSNGLLLLGSGYALSNPWASTTAVGTAIANGPAADSLENGTVTFLLVSGFTGSAGNDLDTNNDGMMDSTPWTAIVDGVGWSDGGGTDRVYSSVVLTQVSGTPDAATRFPSDLTPNSSSTWYNGDILDPTNDGGLDQDYVPAAASSNLPVGGKITPGAANFALTAVPGVTVSETGGVTTAVESGASDTYTIALNTTPTSLVGITVTADPQTEVSTDGVTFTSAIVLSFSDTTAQTIHLRALNDFVAEGLHTGTITHAITSSSDPAYPLSTVIASVSVTITDNDTPGVTVTQSGGTTVLTEAGTVDSYTIALDTVPSGTVQMTVSADSDTEVSSDGVTYSNSITLMFTDSSLKTVHVRAVEDAIDEGFHSGTITHAITSSSDSNYPVSLTISSVTATITDNDITPATGLLINEILFNPPGTDAPNEYVEIRGTAGYVIPSGVYLLGIEGDTTGAGDVQTMFSLAGMTIGSNGYLVLRQSGSTYVVDGGATSLTATGTGTGFQTGVGFSADGTATDIENSSVTFILMQAATAPTLTDDIDSDNNGIADGSVFGAWTVLDSIAVVDNAGDAVFSPVVFSTAASFVGSAGRSVITTTNTANYVARVATSTGSAVSDWFAGGLEGTAPNWNLIAGDAFPASYDGQALNHIGSQNPVATVNQAPVFTSATAFAIEEANTLGVTGPSSSATPYLTSTNPNVQFTSIMTVGDAINGYRMVGIPDGMGAFDNGDGTLTLLVNHELGGTISGAGAATPAGVIRAHGSPGSFVSRWVIDKSTLEVVSIQDFLANGTSVYLSNNNPSAGTAHTAYLAAATTVISRLCSADLAPVSAYQWDDGMGTVYGTSSRIFQSGEESGGIATSTTSGNLGPEGTVHFGRQFAFVATDDPNTALNEAGTAWELPHGGLFAWENNLANPLPQRKTIVMGMDDGSPTGQVYVWVGDKQTTGNVVERAGLTKQSASDNMYVVRVNGLTPDGTGATNETLSTPLGGTFTLENEGDVSGLTFAGFESLSDAKGGTQFLRPEDGQWDPDNPSDFYFVTTSNYDQTKDGVGSTIGRSRLYKLSFTDIAHPELGGTITALLDGTEAGNMFDNMTVSNGKAILQEDPGNQQHLGKIWEYDIATDTLTELAQHDRARFGDVGVPATAPFSQDEENSGVIDVSAIFGTGTYLLNVQAHYNIGDPELVEDGQLLIMRTNVTTGSQLVTTVTATDAESSPLTYSINGGADASKFTIDATTGRLSFILAPDFESPTDIGLDNVYDVTVQVSDGVNNVDQAMQVTVTSVNESPANTTVSTISVAENQTAVTIATGTDPEGVALTFAISGGADAAKFAINPVSGVLTFVAAPDFETPTDNGANNSYFVTVTASDGVNAPVNKTVVVTVTDVVDWTFDAGLLTIPGTSSNDVIKVMSAGGTVRINFNGANIDTLLPLASVTGVSVSGYGGNDSLRLESSLGSSVAGTLFGGEGNDILVGGLGDDTLNGEDGTTH
jgi:hypothetical protein